MGRARGSLFIVRLSGGLIQSGGGHQGIIVIKNQKPKTLALWALIFLLGAGILKQLQDNSQERESVKYSEFVKAVEEGRVDRGDPD